MQPQNQMQALVKREHALTLENLAIPQIQTRDQVLIRVAYAGVCRTDLYVANGLRPARTPIILGHEFAGRVHACGADSHFLPGTSVSVRPEMPCLHCRSCLNSAACERPTMLGIDLDGAFANFVLVPASQVVELPSDVTLQRGALLEPVAAALAIAEAPLHGRGVIVGNNRIATLLARVLASQGIFLDTIELPSSPTLAAHGAGQYDYVIETLANAETLAFCSAILRPGGTLLLKSRPYDAVPINLARLVQKELKLQACNYGCFKKAALLLRDLKLDDLLHAPLPLERFEEGFALAQGGEMKVIFAIGDR